METANISAPQNKLVAENLFAWRDWLGITASIGCAIHCAAMPFIIASLPALGLQFLADESFHKWMALICFLIAATAFVPGIRKHGNWIPIIIGGVGLSLITFAAFGLAGGCCSSCKNIGCNTSQASAVANVASDVGVNHCDQCATCGQSSHETPNVISSKDEEQKSLLSILAPWITPFGGVVLVFAHLLNRSCGGLCECC